MEKCKEEKLGMYEVYRLTLDHYRIAGEDSFRLEEPVVVKMVVDMRDGIPKPVCINRMIDMMREAVLNLSKQEC